MKERKMVKNVEYIIGQTDGTTITIVYNSEHKTVNIKHTWANDELDAEFEIEFNKNVFSELQEVFDILEFAAIGE